jgi:predicted Zn-ribbon and HTH transcriptional regulator
MQDGAQTGIVQTARIQHRQILLFCKQTHPSRLYDLLIQQESMLTIKQITHILYTKERNSALLREIHRVTTEMTTDPSMLVSQQQPLLTFMRSCG